MQKEKNGSADGDKNEEDKNEGDKNGIENKQSESQHGNAVANRKHEKSTKVATPFRRVKSEEINVVDEFKDFSYEGNFGSSGWGAKASEDLIVTKVTCKYFIL